MMYRKFFLLISGILTAATLWGVERVDSKPFETTGTMREETRYVIHVLETQHYLNQPMTEMDTDAFIETFITDLDPQRLFFTKLEVKEYQERFGPSMQLFLDRGRLYPAFVIFEDYRERVYDRVDWIEQRLTEDFSFVGDDTYAPDRTEADWALDEGELDYIWDGRLRYQILNHLLSDMSDAETAAEEVELEAPAVDLDAIPEAEEFEQVETEVAETAEPDKAEEPVAVFVVDDGIEIPVSYLDEAREVVAKRYERLAKSVGEMEASEVQELFLTALTHMYDPHSTFFSADSLEEFAIGMRNSLVGIGAVLSDEDGYCTIKELLPGGPAERSRELDPEDKILGVAQGKEGEFVDVIGMKLSKIVKMIRGKKGSTVRLLIRPAGGDPSARKVISLVRDEIKLTANLARAEVFQVPAGNSTVSIGVIDLPAFYGSGDPSSDRSSTTSDVEELLVKLKDMGVEGIVLDLRRNGGGLLSEAIALTGLFIPDGPVVQVRDVIGKVQGWEDEDSRVVWDGPLIVLVSRFSASASEIVAGALKSHDRAIIVGDEETHGKGTVQAIFEMNRSNFLSSVKPDKGAAKITVQKYYLPNGTSTQIKGVSSDIVLPSVNMFLPIGESDLPHALAWDSIKPLTWDYSTEFAVDGVPLNASLLDNLRDRSLSRQESLEEFTYLNDNIAWLRERQEKEDISLNFAKRYSLLEADDAFHEGMEAALKAMAEHNFESEEVLLEVTEQQNAEHDALMAEREAEEGAEPVTSTLRNEDGERVSVTVKGADGDLEVTVEEEEELPSFDIHLRESLRIMADWIDLNREAERSAALSEAESADKRS